MYELRERLRRKTRKKKTIHCFEKLSEDEGKRKKKALKQKCENQ